MCDDCKEFCNDHAGTVLYFDNGEWKRVCANEAVYCEACDRIMLSDASMIYKGYKIHPECVALVDAADQEDEIENQRRKA